eukprot:1731536-Prymnesium_polylepis.1
MASTLSSARCVGAPAQYGSHPPADQRRCFCLALSGGGVGLRARVACRWSRAWTWSSRSRLWAARGARPAR